MHLRETATARRIHLLPEEIYNRIAAGEVVERPASVLKELIENALDAQATTIEASVSGAGRQEILISDDGEGMGKEDLLMAFERHATSKVLTLEDLQALRTLGFRGEALSAIASVSRLEATSRLRGALLGHRLRLVGGKIQDLEEIGAAEGTTLAIRDLFFNTPARKKFLKTPGVENGHLISVFKRYALAYPDRRWSLEMDGRNVFRLPPEALDQRLLAVFSDDLRNRLFAVNATEASVTLTGFIGAPSLARRTRGDQHLFINRRWIQNRLLNHAVTNAYSRLLQGGLFPFYILFLDLPCGEVDVNVHPAKTEVKLQRENEVYGFILNSIEETLQKAGLLAMPSFSLKVGERVDLKTGEIVPLPHEILPAPGPADEIISTPKSWPPLKVAPPLAYQLVFTTDDQPAKTTEDKSPTPPDTSGAERTQVYQLHKRYIVTEIRGGLAIIDQHAAHERVLYEKALKALSGGQLPSQQLLFPQILTLEAERTEQLRDVFEDLNALGITLREFGERSFVLEALPVGIQADQEGSLIRDILDKLKERGSARRPGQEQVAAAFACRAAIKFGQPLSLAEMNSLIDQLFATRFPFTCPHGRPTLLQLTLGELERRFGRA